MSISYRKAAAAGSGVNSYAEYGYIGVGPNSEISDYWKGQMHLKVGNGFKSATITGIRLSLYKMSAVQMHRAGVPTQMSLSSYYGNQQSIQVQVCESDTFYAEPEDGQAHAIAYATIATSTICPRDYNGVEYGWYYFDLSQLKDAIINHPNAYLQIRNASKDCVYFGVNGDEYDPRVDIQYSGTDATDFSVPGTFYELIEMTQKIPVTITPSGGVYADMKFESANENRLRVDDEGNATNHDYATTKCVVTMTPMDGSTPITKEMWVTSQLGMTVMYGVDGEYKECEVFYGQDDQWKRCCLHYGKNGEWVAHDRREPEIIILPSYA